MPLPWPASLVKHQQNYCQRQLVSTSNSAPSRALCLGDPAMPPDDSPVPNGPPEPLHKDPANLSAPLEPPSAGEQLLRAIVPSKVTVFAVDRNRKVTMLEGGLVCDSQMRSPGWYVGEDVYDVFNRLDPSLPEGQVPPFLNPLQSALAGETVSAQKHEIRREPEKPIFWPHSLTRLQRAVSIARNFIRLSGTSPAAGPPRAFVSMAPWVCSLISRLASMMTTSKPRPPSRSSSTVPTTMFLRRVPPS